MLFKDGIFKIILENGAFPELLNDVSLPRYKKDKQMHYLHF